MSCWALLIFVLSMLVPGSDQLLTSFASSHGLCVNQYNRVYHHGKALPVEKKVSIAVEYLWTQDASNGALPFPSTSTTVFTKIESLCD